MPIRYCWMIPKLGDVKAYYLQRGLDEDFTLEHIVEHAEHWRRLTLEAGAEFSTHNSPRVRNLVLEASVRYRALLLILHDIDTSVWMRDAMRAMPSGIEQQVDMECHHIFGTGWPMCTTALLLQRRAQARMSLVDRCLRAQPPVAPEVADVYGEGWAD